MSKAAFAQYTIEYISGAMSLKKASERIFGPSQ